MAARNLVRVGIKLCISFFFLNVILCFLIRYKGIGFLLRDGDKGIFLSQPFRGDFVILWADKEI
nr:MAG TPA: hypothetical protein [Caudoviricetes sp.]